MLGLLLRVLPFWVREPLLIVIGSVFGLRIMYLAVRDTDRVAAAIGAAFLVFTAIRVHTVVRALRARRNKDEGSASAAGAMVTGAAAPAPGQTPASEQAQAASATVPAQAQELTRTPTADPIMASASAPAPIPAPAATPVQPPSSAPAGDHAGTGPRPGPGKPEKDHNAWGQAVAALAVFGALAAAVWLGPRVMPSADTTPQPASCSDSEHEKLPKAYEKTPRPLTGDDLCEALNRPDLARLLGTPGEIADTASGSNGTAALTDGKVAEPEAEITFDTYTVNLSATYNHLSTAQYVRLFDIAGDRVEKDIKTLEVLGRPAFFSSDHTMRIEIDFSKEHNSGPVQQGPLARTLSVALDRKDRGGYYDITVWSKSGALPNDGALVDIAEKVLPTIHQRGVH
ncbi:DUF6215 domain-containing protein [Streptomyces sp. NPDC058145]|uniref:DUF6215 domain-containing protein n=1 Tax=Streptomyces sp. NPDC058145 TaxID=3346356 RepID=UPI0036E4CBCC